MTTLISYHSSGGDEGRCDAKCYNAKHPNCDCICSGSNHGVGLEQATDNCRELAASWVERARASGQDVATFEVDVTVLLEPLFSARELVAS